MLIIVIRCYEFDTIDTGSWFNKSQKFNFLIRSWQEYQKSIQLVDKLPFGGHRWSSVTPKRLSPKGYCHHLILQAFVVNVVSRRFDAAMILSRALRCKPFVLILLFILLKIDMYL